MSDHLDDLSAKVAKQLHNAGSLLSETERILDEETTSAHRTKWPNVFRLESATKHAQLVLAWADPRVTRKNVADALVSSATQARDTIREAVDSGGGSLIGAANDLLDAIAQVEPRVPPSVEEANATLARLADVQAEIDKMRDQFSQALSDHDSKFSDAQKRRDTRFDDALHKVEDDLRQARTVFDERAAEASEHIAELEEDISKTAAALGGSAIAIDNSKESDEQTVKAFRWTLLTVFLVIVAATIALLIGIESSDQSPESLIGKITVALIFAGIANYTAGVARHHRQRAATARRLAIELNAFGPFIASLEKVDRDDLRSTIVWRFFGPPDAVNQDSDGEPSPGTGILQQLQARQKKRKPPEAKE